MIKIYFSDPKTKNEPEECCNRSPNSKHPYCNEIPIPDDDYFYSKFNIKCIDFVRSFPAVRPGCRLGKEVLINYKKLVYKKYIFYNVFRYLK